MSGSQNKQIGRHGPQIIVVMGVSGVGKSTVARGLASLWGWDFAEGDSFHPQANVDKMRAGAPLTDEDRWPWLCQIRDFIADQIAQGRALVLTCSALKVAYRDLLREAGPQVRFLHLVADRGLLDDRLTQRTGHFMPASLLPSQYDTLEPLTDAELAAGSVVVAVQGDPSQVLTRAVTALGQRGKR